MDIHLLDGSVVPAAPEIEALVRAPPTFAMGADVVWERPPEVQVVRLGTLQTAKSAFSIFHVFYSLDAALLGGEHYEDAKLLEFLLHDDSSAGQYHRLWQRTISVTYSNVAEREDHLAGTDLNRALRAQPQERRPDWFSPKRANWPTHLQRLLPYRGELELGVDSILQRLLVDSLRLHLFGDYLESRWVLKLVVEETDAYPG